MYSYESWKIIKFSFMMRPLLDPSSLNKLSDFIWPLWNFFQSFVNRYNLPVKHSVLLWESRGNPFQKVLVARGSKTQVLQNLHISQSRVLCGWPNSRDGDWPHSMSVLFLSSNQSVFHMCWHCARHLGTAVNKAKPLLLREEELWSRNMCIQNT